MPCLASYNLCTTNMEPSTRLPVGEEGGTRRAMCSVGVMDGKLDPPLEAEKRRVGQAGGLHHRLRARVAPDACVLPSPPAPWFGRVCPCQVHMLLLQLISFAGQWPVFHTSSFRLPNKRRLLQFVVIQIRGWEGS
jgi:hypothetical protein